MNQSAANQPSGLRKAIQTTGLLLISVIVALVLAELITRVVAPQLAPNRADRVLFCDDPQDIQLAIFKQSDS